MRVLCYCLMPNHFHLVLWPRRDGDLSRWMQWLLTAHVRRYHRLRGSSGHVWQGRFKAFPIQQDEHLLTVMRVRRRNRSLASASRHEGGVIGVAMKDAHAAVAAVDDVIGNVADGTAGGAACYECLRSEFKRQ